MYFKPPTPGNNPANPFYHPLNDKVNEATRRNTYRARSPGVKPTTGIKLILPKTSSMAQKIQKVLDGDDPKKLKQMNNLVIGREDDGKEISLEFKTAASRERFRKMMNESVELDEMKKGKKRSQRRKRKPRRKKRKSPKKRKKRSPKKKKRTKTKKRMRKRRTKKKRKRKSRKKKRKKSRKRKRKRNNKSRNQNQNQSKTPLSLTHPHPINLQVFQVSLTIHKKQIF